MANSVETQLRLTTSSWQAGVTQVSARCLLGLWS